MRRPAYRKKGYKKTNRIKRRGNRRNYRAILKGNLHRVSRMVQLPDFVLSGLIPNITVTQTYDFNLAQLDDSTEFTNLFEKYRIKAIQFKMFPMIQSNNPGQTYMPVLAYCRQTSSGVTPATLSNFMQQDNVKLTRANKPITIYLKPFVDTEVYKSSVSTGYSGKRGLWINTTDDTVPHYGVNLLGELPAVGPIGSTEYQRYRVFAKFYMEFIGTH